jgi:hypothetical protein
MQPSAPKIRRPRPVPRPARCIYQGSNQLRLSIFDTLDEVASRASECSSFYLDTTEDMKHTANGGHNHHQGLARTHLLSDGSIYFFLSHSRIGAHGTFSRYKYTGPLDGEHVLGHSKPLAVAGRVQLLEVADEHPADIVFLPDVNNLDSGYVFVTEAYDTHGLAIYPWDTVNGLQKTPFYLPQGFAQGPDFVFVDRVGETYFLGLASSDSGFGILWQAAQEDLFPTCKKHGMQPTAFQPASPVNMYPFPPIGGSSQVKLVRDAQEDWYLLAFRGDPPDETEGIDYVDVFGVNFNPFGISTLLASVHVSFRSGDTGFASTGTHYVDKTGRLLLSSSYRWAEDEGPGDSGYVSRVDECPSA